MTLAINNNCASKLCDRLTHDEYLFNIYDMKRSNLFFIVCIIVQNQCHETVYL